MKSNDNQRHKVYLSYSARDGFDFSTLKKQLKNAGIQLIDPLDFLTCNMSISLQEEINKQIMSCDCMAIIVSEGWNDAIDYEFTIARESNKKILPFVKATVSVPDLPVSLKILKFSSWENREDLQKKLYFTITGYFYGGRAGILEEFAQQLFEKLGCTIAAPDDYTISDWDLEAEKNGIQYRIECKYSRQRDLSMQMIRSAEKVSLIEKGENEKSVFLCVNEIPVQVQKTLRESGWDYCLSIVDLLYAAKRFPEISDMLLFILDYNVDDIPVPGDPPELFRDLLGLTGVETAPEPEYEESKLEALIRRVEEWNSSLCCGREHSGEYEKLCTEVLKELFLDDLTLWNEQQYSNESLYRFDLICRIKDDAKATFWPFLERFFHTKYVVFEFKNYNGRITQKEIYTTERYLYATALRNAAIIISCHGTDEHADHAIHGALRENGKLIISLSNQDLIKMLKIKKDGPAPADFLYDKADAMLVELGK